MTQEEIIEIARQAGWSGIYTQWAEPTGEADWSPFKVSLTVPVTMQQIEAFAKLVAAKATEEANARANASWTLMCKKMVAFEREACANLCWKNEDDNAFVNHGGKRLDLLCAELIKARGEE